MEISLRKLSRLSLDETIFIFSMMRKYGGMPEVKPDQQQKKSRGNNNKRRTSTKKVDTSDKTKPNLFDFTDPKWEKCEDEKFLAYKEIMERPYNQYQDRYNCRS